MEEQNNEQHLEDVRRSKEAYEPLLNTLKVSYASRGRYPDHALSVSPSDTFCAAQVVFRAAWLPAGGLVRRGTPRRRCFSVRGPPYSGVTNLGDPSALSVTEVTTQFIGA